MAHIVAATLAMKPASLAIWATSTPTLAATIRLGAATLLGQDKTQKLNSQVAPNGLGCFSYLIAGLTAGLTADTRGARAPFTAQLETEERIAKAIAEKEGVGGS
jgi:hypothetical protein